MSRCRTLRLCSRFLALLQQDDNRQRFHVCSLKLEGIRAQDSERSTIHAALDRNGLGIRQYCYPLTISDYRSRHAGWH